MYSLNLLIRKFIFYLIVIGFLFPMGYANYYPTYKKVQTMYIGGLLIIILLICFYRILQKRLKIDRSGLFLIFYSLTLLLITLWKQGSINQGFQKIFVIPCICLIFADYLQRNPEIVISTLTNVLLILLFLNIIVFNQLLFPQLFLVDNHITFLGHVQVVSEIGLLAVFVGYLNCRYFDTKFKGCILILLALCNMIYVETSASYIAIFELIIFVVLGKNLNFRKIICKSLPYIILILIIVSLFLINIKIDSNTLAWDKFLNGRLSIWNKGILFVKESLLFGYGAYGVKIQMFWSQWVNNGIGFNYAHNTVLQLLLDGGIALTVIYTIMLLSYTRDIELVKYEKIKFYTSIIMIIFVTVGLVESLTEYNYFFIYLSILPYVPLLMEEKNESLKENNS